MSRHQTSGDVVDSHATYGAGLVCMNFEKRKQRQRCQQDLIGTPSTGLPRADQWSLGRSETLMRRQTSESSYLNALQVSTPSGHTVLCVHVIFSRLHFLKLYIYMLNLIGTVSAGWRPAGIVHFCSVLWQSCSWAACVDTRWSSRLQISRKSTREPSRHL